MELLSAAWLSALLAIVLIDLVLAGDNAIVIALAERKLPAHLKTKAIVWGTVGAIVVRTIMTVGVVWLLKVPGLSACSVPAGGPRVARLPRLAAAHRRPPIDAFGACRACANVPGQ